MPSLQTWQQVLPPADLHFNSSTIVLRNHHNPPGGLNTSNFANSSQGMAQMTIAAEQWYPVSRGLCTQQSSANIHHIGPEQDRQRRKLLRLVPHNPDLPSRLLQIRDPILPSRQRLSEQATGLPLLATRRHLAGAFMGWYRI